MNAIDLDIGKLADSYSKEFGDETTHRMMGEVGVDFTAGLIAGAEVKYSESDPEFLKDYKKMIQEKFGRDSEMMKQIRDEVALAGGEQGLRSNAEAKQKIKNLIDKNIRAAFNYRKDLIQEWRKIGKPWDEADQKSRERSNELYDQAMKKFEKGDFDQALYLFHKSYAQAENPSSLILIAQTYDKLGDKEKAKKAAGSALKRAQRLVEKDPNESNLIILKNAEDVAKSQGLTVEERETPTRKELTEADKVFLVMTDHTASRTSPHLYKQAVKLKADFDKAEDKKAWIDSHKEDLEPLKKRLPKVLGWEGGLGIVRKESGEVEKDPTNASRPAGPSAAPKSSPVKSQEGLEGFAVADVKIEDLKEKPKVGKPKEKAPEWAQKEAKKDEKAGWKKYTRGKESVIVHVPEKKTDDGKTEFYDPAEKPA